MKKEDKSAAIAAAAILAGTFVVFFFMPNIMMSAAEISPWLAVGIGACAVLAFFAVFWLRGRFGSASKSSGEQQDSESQNK